MNIPGIPDETGQLSVDIESESIYFGYNVPIEIRDSRMNLVERTETGRQFELSPGFYEVSAVLEDGRDHSELVEVRTGEQSSVHLRAIREAVEELTRGRPTLQRDYETPRFTQRLDSIDVQPATTDIDVELGAELLGVAGAEAISSEPGLWVFKSKDTIDSVPTARFRLGEHITTISLPTSPRNAADHNTCAVRLNYSSVGLRVSAWISGERIVANAFMNMLASGQVRQAAHMADRATELLREKYSDPTGAVLGALILQKVGKLERLESWVRNLATDFEWMPDGKILLASILLENRNNLDEAMQLALDASNQRMLYTDSYSILLDMMRRWPREHNREGLRDAMVNLAEHSPYIDWDSICLSNTKEG